MARRLFTLLSALSLLLCVVVSVLAVRSYWAYEGVQRVTWDPHRNVYSVSKVEWANGSVFFHSRSSSYPVRQGWMMGGALGWRFYSEAALERGALWPSLFPFHSHRASGKLTQGPWSILEVTVPHWSLILLLAVLPVVWLVRWRRHRRLSRIGLCPSCGYDLRATPGRCPECGAVRHDP